MPQGIYLPEALMHETVVPLQEAWLTDRILRGRAALCTQEHDLILDYGGKQYCIDREEAAEGIREGSVRDIAILSRVGKPICFRVLDNTGEDPILSRRAAQEEARNYFLNGGLEPGDIIRTVVTHLEPFGAFTDIGCGVTSLIGIEGISVSRIRHPAERFRLHQEVPAVVTKIDRQRGHVMLSHRELLGSWQENAGLFAAGQTVEGIVRTVEPYGIFVELLPNLSGLAEYRPGIEPGDAVSVYIKSIIPEKMKIKLMIIDKLPAGETAPLQPDDYFLQEGHLDYWQYSPDCCRTKRVCTVFR